MAGKSDKITIECVQFSLCICVTVKMVATPMTSMCPILLAVISNQDVGKSRQSGL